MTDSHAPETFRPFLGVPPEALYAVSKAAVAAARLESLLRGMVVGFMEYEAGQKLLAEGDVGPSATRVARCLKEQDTPADRGWYERVEAFMAERGTLMHSSPSKVRMDGEWVDHLLQMRDGKYVKLDVDKLHALAATGAHLYNEAIDAIGAEVFGALRGELAPVEGSSSGQVG